MFNAMFTLDSTTLFYFDLSNHAYSSKTSNSQRETVGEWAQGVPQNPSNPKSVRSSVPSLITSGSARTHAATSNSARSIVYPEDEVMIYDDGGRSDRDERTGAEATRARNSPLKNGRRVTQEVGHPLLLAATFPDFVL
jgi:hypothetical protein